MNVSLNKALQNRCLPVKLQFCELESLTKRDLDLIPIATCFKFFSDYRNKNYHHNFNQVRRYSIGGKTQLKFHRSQLRFEICHCRQGLSNYSFNVSRKTSLIPLNSGCSVVGMNAKVAKTKIIMLDGFPCYGDNAVLKVMELRELRKNLTSQYPFGGPLRVEVPEDKIEWCVPWPEYDPPEFTTAGILKGDKEWADKELRLTDVGLWPKWNQQDGGINRISHHGVYKTDADGYPLNPAGRTGIRGRGSLGRWATNHAADCIITRWKQAEDGSPCTKDGRPVLQFIGIIRKDTGEAAFPGGMIDAGEDAMTAVKREFLEEVFSIEDATEEERLQLEDSLKSVFVAGETVYKGYVDDRRNTDNAWIETQAINFSLNETNDHALANLKFKAGSDAKGALWIDIDENVKLYASHKSILEILVKKLDAYW